MRTDRNNVPESEGKSLCLVHGPKQPDNSPSAELDSDSARENRNKCRQERQAVEHSESLYCRWIALLLLSISFTSRAAALETATESKLGLCFGFCCGQAQALSFGRSANIENPYEDVVDVESRSLQAWPCATALGNSPTGSVLQPAKLTCNTELQIIKVLIGQIQWR